MINWFEKHSRVSCGITILISVIIFYISSQSFAHSSKQSNLMPIIYHFCAFFFLAFFLLISSIRGKEKYLIFALVILISVLYGISDEFHQFFVPGRHCSFSDVFIDTLGIFFASIIYFISIKFRVSSPTKFKNKHYYK